MNVAARLQAQCEPDKVLIGHSTFVLVRDDIACVPKGEIDLKGFRQPVAAYEVSPAAVVEDDVQTHKRELVRRS